jgi:hypothetical protein
MVCACGLDSGGVRVKRHISEFRDSFCVAWRSMEPCSFSKGVSPSCLHKDLWCECEERKSNRILPMGLVDTGTHSEHPQENGWCVRAGFCSESEGDGRQETPVDSLHTTGTVPCGWAVSVFSPSLFFFKNSFHSPRLATHSPTHSLTLSLTAPMPCLCVLPWTARAAGACTAMLTHRLVTQQPPLITEICTGAIPSTWSTLLSTVWVCESSTPSSFPFRFFNLALQSDRPLSCHVRRI